MATGIKASAVLWLPVNPHIVIFSLLVAFNIPLLVFAFLQYISSITALFVSFAQAFLAGWLGGSIAGLMHIRSGPVMPIVVGMDKSAIGISFGAIVLCIVGIINLSLAFGGCGSHNTDLSLMEFTFNQTCAVANLTLTVGDPILYRRPMFAFQYGWYQACLDDMPVLIALIALFAADIGVDIAVIVHMWRARDI